MSEPKSQRLKGKAAIVTGGFDLENKYEVLTDKPMTAKV
jgi:hypothetical protein